MSSNPTILAQSQILPYRCVKMTATAGVVAPATSSTDIVFGVTTDQTTSTNGSITFQQEENNFVLLTAGGSISVGNLLNPSTGGTVVASTDGGGQFIATESASSGETLWCRYSNSKSSSSQINYLAPSSSTVQEVSTKLAEVFSVKDFGAVGNGVTDDTVAIQTAVTAATGKALYFPAGTYVTTAAISVPGNSCLYAEKGSATIAVQPTANTATFNNGFVTAGNNITIDGLKIVGTNEYSLVGGARTEYASAIAMNGTAAYNIDIFNCEIVAWGWGIYLRRISSWRIIGNRCWGGNQTGTDVPVLDATCWDIGVNSNSFPASLQGFRGIISDNMCLSNVDTGLGVGANSDSDKDIVIANNIIQPLQVDGITPLANANNKSRYGITTSYGGTAPARIVVGGNVVRDVAISGIYVQGLTMPTGDIAINGNMVSNCGFDTLQPTYASLKAGIWVKGGADSICGNVVVDCFRAGIQCDTLQTTPPSGVQLSRSVVGNNNIARILNDPNPGSDHGFGVYLTGYNNSRILVANNRIQNTAQRAIDSHVITNDSDNGGIHIVGNLVEVAHTKGAISLRQGGALVSQSSVVANHIVGNDSTTSNSGLNAGIWIDGKVHCVGNTIRNFYRGIEATVSGRVTDRQCTGNAISNCNFGISGQSNGPWLVTANTFTNITTRNLNAGVYQGTLMTSFGDNGVNPVVIHFVDEAAPTTGTWQKGDYCKNTDVAIGSPKGWYCTVAGTPGTWVSEGNL